MVDPLRAGAIAPPASAHPDPFRLRERLPVVLHVAFWIQVAGAAYSALNLALILVGFNRGAFLAHAHAVARQKNERILPDSFVIQVYLATMVFFAVVIVLDVVVALLVRRGLSWARILLTVAIALGVVGAIGSTDPLAALVGLALNGSVLVLIWLPPSNRYFRAVKVSRQQHRARQL